MIHAIKTSEEPKGVLIVHRNFDGDHVFDGDICWCRPETVEPDSLRDSDEIVERLEKCDG